MDSFGIDSFSFGAIFTTVFGIICGLIGRVYEHNKNAIFDTALSKIYNVLEVYIESATSFKDSINALPTDALKKGNFKILDEQITMPLFNLTNKTLMLEMFFDENERKSIQKILEIAIDFNASLHRIFANRHISSEIELDNSYDRARVKFNEDFKAAMNVFIELIHSKLLGKWQRRNFKNPFNRKKQSRKKQTKPRISSQ